MNFVDIDRLIVRRGGLRSFVELAWREVVGQTFVPGVQIDLICDRLERASFGEIDRLIINVPPGTGKSLLVSVFWPAWEWTLDPTLRWMSTSHDRDLALRDARMARKLVSSAWYQERWPYVRITKSRDETEAASIYYTTAGGLRYSTTIGSRGVGWHAHRQIVDDPHKPLAAEAVTGVELDKADVWWRKTMATRGVPGKRLVRVIVMQRLHPDDLSGRCIDDEKQSWHVLCLPMKYDPDHPHVCADDPREPGVLLCPDLKTAKIVEDEEIALGPDGAAAQHQQHPVPPGGALFLDSWLSYWGALDSVDYLISSWDMTMGAKAKSWDCGQIWGVKGQDLYLLWQYRERLDFPGMKAIMRRAVSEWAPIVQLVEAQAAGRPLVQELTGEIPGLVEIPATGGTGGKRVRAQATTGLWQAGKIHLPDPGGVVWRGRRLETRWVLGFIERWLRFRGSPADVADEIDTMSQAVIYVRGSAGVRFVRAMDQAKKGREAA